MLIDLSACLVVLVEVLGPESTRALVNSIERIQTAGGYGRVTLTIEKSRLRWIETTVSEAAPGGIPPAKH